jgi:hypothetical protein
MAWCGGEGTEGSIRGTPSMGEMLWEYRSLSIPAAVCLAVVALWAVDRWLRPLVAPDDRGGGESGFRWGWVLLVAALAIGAEAALLKASGVPGKSVIEVVYHQWAVQKGPGHASQR